MQQDYVCVSTYGQTPNAQLEQLRREGCAKVFREKTSGAQADRRQLLRLLKGLTRGDVVIVTRIDRLARSPSAAQRAEARRRRFEGATLQELADSYNVGRATISRLAV